MRPSSAKALQTDYEIRARRIFARLPLAGSMPRIEAAPGLRDRRGPVHAGAFLRQGRIAFDCTRAEFPRVFVHELFHFAWLRAGNPVRWSYEDLLRSERRARARGELGWSAEWRKRALTPAEAARRSRLWREYCCESFCDTAAWMYSGVDRHPEFTLPARYRDFRQRWFIERIENRRISL